MNLVYHPVGVKLTEAFRGQAAKKLGHALHVFHNITSVNLFIKAEHDSIVLEVLVAADDERLYVSQEETDLGRGLEKLADRLAENARKQKTRQRKHSSKKTEHHNHLVLHRNIGAHADVEPEEDDVYSAKPLSRFEAFLELRISSSDLLIYRDNETGRVQIMLKEHGSFFLISPRLPGWTFSLGRRPKAQSFEQFEFTYQGSRFRVLKKTPFTPKTMDTRAALAVLKKEDFCFYIDKVRGGYSILFRYGRGRVGLVDHIEV
jgi:ribosomal subunit interface protein